MAMTAMLTATTIINAWFAVHGRYPAMNGACAAAGAACLLIRALGLRA